MKINLLKMAEFTRKLSFGSFNCEHADDVRLPYLSQLFDDCDLICMNRIVGIV